MFMPSWPKRETSCRLRRKMRREEKVRAPNGSKPHVKGLGQDRSTSRHSRPTTKRRRRRQGAKNTKRRSRCNVSSTKST